jgi:hypothetical protein
MTTTPLRAMSLQERLALLGFAETLFVIAGDSNEHVLFTTDARNRRCSFVFWTEDTEKKILTSLASFGMPVDEQDGMIIAVKELIGPVAAICHWGADHHG